MRWADREKVEKAAEEWPDKFIQCRIYGHSWRPLTVARHGAGYEVTQRCSSCRNQRSQDMDSNGYSSPWRMTYVDNYLLKDMGRVDGDGRAVLRLAAIRHMKIIDDVNEEDVA